MLIVTNFERFPERWTAVDGTCGHTVFAHSAPDFVRYGREPNSVFVINCDARLVLDVARKQLLSLTPRRPIIGVDLILREPRGLPHRMVAFGKKLLFRRVDGFVHYFKDFSAIHGYYGVGDARAEFVNFKANLWSQRSSAPQPDGEYVVCFGRSLRDFDTFFDAVERVGCPAVIVDPRVSLAWEHGSRFTRPIDQLPPNVRMVPYGTTDEDQARLLREAKLVVVTLIKGALVAPISTLLNAMALGKCAITSSGPGVSDLFDDEVIAVPPEDAGALAHAIERAWGDDALRSRTATAGWEYAQHCGGEQDLYGRIIEVVARKGRTGFSAATTRRQPAHEPARAGMHAWHGSAGVPPKKN